MIAKAVIDRVEEGLAVLLVGEQNDRLVVPIESLPAGVQEGDWLQVDVEDDRVLSATLDETETLAAKKRIAAKLEILRRGGHRD